MTGYMRQPVNLQADELRGRIFQCQQCRGVHEIVEIPVPFIDPDLYVCDACNGADPQLVFEQLGPAGRLIRDDTMPRRTRRYDPKIARISYDTDPRQDWLAREPPIELDEEA